MLVLCGQGVIGVRIDAALDVSVCVWCFADCWRLRVRGPHGGRRPGRPKGERVESWVVPKGVFGAPIFVLSSKQQA